MRLKVLPIALAALLVSITGGVTSPVAQAKAVRSTIAPAPNGASGEQRHLREFVQSDDPSAPIDTSAPRYRRSKPKSEPRLLRNPFALPTAPITVRPKLAKPSPSTGPQGSEFPPYERELLRLAEILGAMHYLRGLCAADDGNLWRARMEELISAEAPQPAWRARLVESFNSGYRGFNRTYRQCTPSATQAMQLYITEGESLTGIIRTRYAD